MFAGGLLLCCRAGASGGRIAFRPGPVLQSSCFPCGPFRGGGVAWGSRSRADTRPGRGLSCGGGPASEPYGCGPFRWQPFPRIRAHFLSPCLRGSFAGQAMDFERRCGPFFRLPNGSFRAARTSRRPGRKARWETEAPDHGSARSVAGHLGRDGRAYKRPTGGASKCPRTSRCRDRPSRTGCAGPGRSSRQASSVVCPSPSFGASGKSTAGGSPSAGSEPSAFAFGPEVACTRAGATASRSSPSCCKHAGARSGRPRCPDGRRHFFRRAARRAASGRADGGDGGSEQGSFGAGGADVARGGPSVGLGLLQQRVSPGFPDPRPSWRCTRGPLRRR